MLEKRIEIRWRDVDAYGHVNNAVYLNYLEEARDALGPGGARGRLRLDVGLRPRPRRDRLPRASSRQDDGAVIVRCALDRIGALERRDARGGAQAGRDDLGRGAVGGGASRPRDGPLPAPHRSPNARRLEAERATSLTG